MKNILVVVSAPNESVSAHFTNSLVASVKVSREFDFHPVFFREGSDHMVLNMGITLAWQEKLDGVVFIGPDVSWKSADLIKLCSTTKDAIGIPLFDGSLFSVDLGDISRLEKDETTGEVKVESTSPEFIYLSSLAVDKLCTSHPLMKFAGREVKTIMQGSECFNNYFTTNELLAFRLREVGIEVWIDPLCTAVKAIRVTQDVCFNDVLNNLQQ